MSVRHMIGQRSVRQANMGLMTGSGIAQCAPEALAAVHDESADTVTCHTELGSLMSQMGAISESATVTFLKSFVVASPITIPTGAYTGDRQLKITSNGKAQLTCDSGMQQVFVFTGPVGNVAITNLTLSSCTGTAIGAVSDNQENCNVQILDLNFEKNNNLDGTYAAGPLVSVDNCNSLQISGCKFTGNDRRTEKATFGGLVSISRTNQVTVNAVVQSNMWIATSGADRLYGLVHAHDCGTLTVTQSSFDANQISSEGAMCGGSILSVRGVTNTVIENTEMSGNTLKCATNVTGGSYGFQLNRRRRQNQNKTDQSSDTTDTADPTTDEQDTSTDPAETQSQTDDPGASEDDSSTGDESDSESTNEGEDQADDSPSDVNAQELSSDSGSQAATPTLTITGSSFRKNTAETRDQGSDSIVRGGAIYVSGISTIAIQTTEFSGNTITAHTVDGGAIFIDRAQSIGISQGSVTANRAVGTGPARGGAMCVVGSCQTDVTISSGAEFSNNQASSKISHAQGGAIAMVGVHRLLLQGARLNINTAQSRSTGEFRATGGALHFGGNFLAATENTQVDGNQATGPMSLGGGISFSGFSAACEPDACQGADCGSVTLNTAELNGNKATATVAVTQAGGGGLSVMAGSDVTITSSTINGNVAGLGGGVYLVNNRVDPSGLQPFRVTGTSLSCNKALFNGSVGYARGYTVDESYATEANQAMNNAANFCPGFYSADPQNCGSPVLPSIQKAVSCDCGEMLVDGAEIPDPPSTSIGSTFRYRCKEGFYEDGLEIATCVAKPVSEWQLNNPDFTCKGLGEGCLRGTPDACTACQDPVRSRVSGGVCVCKNGYWDANPSTSSSGLNCTSCLGDPHCEAPAADCDSTGQGLCPANMCGDGYYNIWPASAVCMFGHGRIGQGVQFGVNVTLNLQAGTTIGSNVVVGNDCVLEDGAELADDVRLAERVTIGANAVVGSGTMIGADSILSNQSNVATRCFLGNNITLGPGVFVGNGSTLGHDIVVGSDTRILTNVTMRGDAWVGPGTTIGKEAYVETDVIIQENGFVAEGVHLGAQVRLMPRTYVGVNSRIWERATVGLQPDKMDTPTPTGGYVTVLGENCSLFFGSTVEMGVSVGDHVEVGSESQVSSYAALGSGSKVGTSVSIGRKTIVQSNTTIESNVQIGAENTIGKGSYIQRDVRIGKGNNFGVGVTVLAGARVGDNGTYEDYAVIGSAPSAEENSNDHAFGIVVGVAVGMAITTAIVIGGVCWRRHQKRKKKSMFGKMLNDEGLILGGISCRVDTDGRSETGTVFYDYAFNMQAPLATWTPEQVVQFIRNCPPEYHAYIPMIAKEKITGQLLSEISQDEFDRLLTNLGVTALGHRTYLLHAFEKHRAPYQARRRALSASSVSRSYTGDYLGTYHVPQDVLVTPDSADFLHAPLAPWPQANEGTSLKCLQDGEYDPVQPSTSKPNIARSLLQVHSSFGPGLPRSPKVTQIGTTAASPMKAHSSSESSVWKAAASVELSRLPSAQRQNLKEPITRQQTLPM